MFYNQWVAVMQGEKPSSRGRPRALEDEVIDTTSILPSAFEGDKKMEGSGEIKQVKASPDSRVTRSAGKAEHQTINSQGKTPRKNNLLPLPEAPIIKKRLFKGLCKQSPALEQLIPQDVIDTQGKQQNKAGLEKMLKEIEEHV